MAGPGRVVEPQLHRVEGRLVLCEEGFALGRDRVLLALALLGADLRMAKGTLDTAQIRAVTEAIDAAAKAIERS